MTAKPVVTAASLGLASPEPQIEKHDGRISLKLQPTQRIAAGKLKLQNLEFLGKGGTGSVYRMMITEGNLRGLIVAVKFLETIQDRKRVQRFEEEVKLLQSMDHPHVIKFLDLGIFGTWQPVNFFVMEYQPRNLLREMRAHPRGLHPDVFLPLCLQIASALAAVHAADIVHRDLKPSNILFDGTNVKIADFGIARRSRDTTDVKGFTSSGEKVAPKYHMSPEQFHWWKKESDVAPDKPSDVYQFGLIMYQLLTGFNPNTVTYWSVDKATREDPVSRIFTSQSGSLLNDVSSLTRGMLCINPDDRPEIGDVQQRLLDMFHSYASHYSALYGIQPGREY